MEHTVTQAFFICKETVRDALLIWSFECNSHAALQCGKYFVQWLMRLQTW